MAKHRRLRVGDRLDDDTLVVRGGELEPETLRRDAERYDSVYGEYGISVVALRGIPLEVLLQQAPLVRFEVFTVMAAGMLRAAGFRLDPTGRNGAHFTAVFDALDAGIDALAACEHRTMVNPYHDD